MPTSYTDDLKLAKPAVGELSNTWGTVVNENITEMIEEAITGRASISGWAANAYTLSVANGTTSESRCVMLDLSGALTAKGTLTIPSGQKKMYLVRNGTTGDFAVDVGMSTGDVVEVPNGASMIVYCDGTNTFAVTTPTTEGGGGVLAISEGGTGATTASGARTNLGAQVTLVSGTNIKTVGGQSLLGSGDITTTVPDATTSIKGIVQLSTSTASTSTSLAATPSAVKQAYDLANSAVPKDSGHNNIGSFCIAYSYRTTSTSPGVAIAGSLLFPAGISGLEELDQQLRVDAIGTSLSGTWRCMGRSFYEGGSSPRRGVTLWQRIS